MKKEELIKLIKSLPDDKCLVTFICGRPYILSCKDIELSKGSRCYMEMIIADCSILTSTENYTTLYEKKPHHETTLHIICRHDLSINEDCSLLQNIEIHEDRIDKYKYVVVGSHYKLPLNFPFMKQQKIDELLELKEQEKMKEEKKKQDEFNELVSKLKEHFVEFKKDAGISNITTPITGGINMHATTTGKVNTNTDVRKSVIFTDCPRNEKWSDETILSIVNFVNSGIVCDEKQYTIVSRAGIGFLGDLADHVLIGHVWDIKNKRALVLKEKHKKCCLLFKNGKYNHLLDIIQNEDIVASYKVEGVL